MSDKEEVSPQEKGKTGMRSPSYPRIDLKQAIEFTRLIYDKEKKGKVHLRTIVKHCGYNNMNAGTGKAVQAALKYYGLIDVEGSGDNRKAWLTELSLDILLDKRCDSKKRKEAIKKAALNPGINSELWEKYDGNLVSREELEYHLIRERGFTEKGMVNFLSNFYSTLEYSDLILPSDEEKTKNPQSDKPKKEEAIRHPNRDGVHSYILPLTTDCSVELLGSFPLTEEEWDRMMDVLKAMKAGLVEKEIRQLPAPSTEQETE